MCPSAVIHGPIPNPNPNPSPSPNLHPNPNPDPDLIKGTYPKGVNAQDARIKFRRRMLLSPILTLTLSPNPNPNPYLGALTPNPES